MKEWTKEELKAALIKFVDNLPDMDHTTLDLVRGIREIEPITDKNGVKWQNNEVTKSIGIKIIYRDPNGGADEQLKRKPERFAEDFLDWNPVEPRRMNV